LQSRLTERNEVKSLKSRSDRDKGPKLLALAVWQPPEQEFKNGLWLASYARPALGTI